MTAGPLQMPATWDAVADGYADFVTKELAPWLDEEVRLAALAKTDRVLDVAAGPGTLTLRAARRVASVVAVDFAPGMIEELQKRAAREGIANVEARVMDAQALDLADASFDVAFCSFGFMFFPDRARAFAEIARVLKPGGRLVIATWAPIDRRPAMKLGFEAFAEAVPQLPRPAKGDLQSTDECEQEMRAAGFRDVVATTFSASMSVASAEDYVRSMERSAAPLAILKKKMGEDAWRAARARVVEAVKARVTSWPADLAAEAIFTRGVR